MVLQVPKSVTDVEKLIIDNILKSIWRQNSCSVNKSHKVNNRLTV